MKLYPAGLSCPEEFSSRGMNPVGASDQVHLRWCAFKIEARSEDSADLKDRGDAHLQSVATDIDKCWYPQSRL